MDQTNVRWVFYKETLDTPEDNANLGVLVNGRVFTLYKGQSLERNPVGVIRFLDFLDFKEVLCPDRPYLLETSPQYQPVSSQGSEKVGTAAQFEALGEAFQAFDNDARNSIVITNPPRADIFIPNDDNELQVIGMLAGDIPPRYGAWFGQTVEILQAKSLVTRGDDWALTKHGEAFYASYQKQLEGVPYQTRVVDWFEHTFGMSFSDVLERYFRYGEESIELMQAGGVSREDMHALVDYVCDRPVGVVKQEIGGTITTLMILCHVLNIDFEDAAETELRQVWGRVEKIRQKQASKPHASPLPGKEIVE